jgi:signal transduction histidine kinase
MWAADYAMWVYYEVLRCLPMPTPQPGDMLLLLHLIPTMMALAMLPHLAFKRKDAGSSSLDFALIACWWVYLYFQFVFVWQVLEYNPQAFHQNFNFFYRAELATIILALFYLSQHSEGDWQEIFNHYLVAFLLYAPASAIINILIQQHRYTSGGFWDLPLTISLAYLAWIGFRARSLKLQSRTGTDVEYGVSIPTWVASIAVASIPAIALFSYERFDDGPIVRHFRVALGFSSILVIAALIFTRQQLLNRRLSLLLIDSKRAYRNLERLQGQMMQSEKLASIGKLVAGAAHELNNPLTAILGYSELISTDPTMPATPRGFAEKIGQQARRTKSLVESLLSFARQTPSRKRLTDFNSLVGNACQLRLVSMPPKISLVRDLQPDLPMVMADDNHLLQVFLHLLNNAIDAVGEVGGGEIIVRTQARNGRVILEVCDNGPGIAEPERIFDPFYTTKPVGQGTGLGLSASYGIVQEHEGTIECSNLSPHGAMFCISLQAVAAEPTASPAVARAVAYPGSAPAAND